MKKTTLFFAACLMGISALKSQIVVTQADFPATGNVFAEANDSTINTYTPGASGASVTWNYSTLKDTAIDTIKCIAKTGIFAVLFPAATSEITYSMGNLLEAFINNGVAALNVYGGVELYNAHPLPIVYRPGVDSLYLSPTNYLSKWQSRYAYRLQIPFADSVYDSLRIQNFIIDSDYVDGFGTCITPYGTKSVLRRQQREFTLDSTYKRDTVTSTWNFIRSSRALDTSYDWVAKGLGYPMLSMKIKNGRSTVASWLKNTNATGIDEITDKSSSLVYPNPANTVLNIRLASCPNGIITVIDMTGREISITAFSNQLANINTSALPGGMYFYRITDKTGNFIDAGKFTVIK